MSLPPLEGSFVLGQGTADFKWNFVFQKGRAITETKEKTQEAELGKSPRRTPQRKKHRPKVVREAKSPRTPKQSTPKPAKPSPESSIDDAFGKSTHRREEAEKTERISGRFVRRRLDFSLEGDGGWSERDLIRWTRKKLAILRHGPLFYGQIQAGEREEIPKRKRTSIKRSPRLDLQPLKIFRGIDSDSAIVVYTCKIADPPGEDKEKLWEYERQVFSGRVDTFIAKMRLVQGNRGFSPWKGSVLDSVIGVFLTQNVSDHLSSSAFMSMVARFPLATDSATEKGRETLDSLDWGAVRRATIDEISSTIRDRGMNNMLARRIKGFLERLEEERGSLDLEWLRDVPPDQAKDFLLNIQGLGLKSVECVRLLTLHHLAFPVDTNVGRICVRLGWVPLQPLPESLQLHLLDLYPNLETIQKYLWPRLSTLDQRTLYELHYQMITFGKVFCTKIRPNCNACPMRGECKHFASAVASSRLALPCPDERRLATTFMVHRGPPIPQIEANQTSSSRNNEPIVEEPDSPRPESPQIPDIEDLMNVDPDEIPVIRLNTEEFSQNLQDYIQKNNGDLQDFDFSKALVMINQEAASIPPPKLKNIGRLRTEHHVYELPDSHPLLGELAEREAPDPCPYLLAIWSPGETSPLEEATESCVSPQSSEKLCDQKSCFPCNCVMESQSQTVRGTLLIPCRTAMVGKFPLNGTYFQVNEVFADHRTSLVPLAVCRSLIWNLPRRTVYFGTSISAIFRGLAIQGIQSCFWRGFVCVRGFDRKTRGPMPLMPRLHSPAGKVTRNKRNVEMDDE
ncbi:DNA glycosylase/AP lyase ROS1-like [Wolffia australiana]